MIALGSGCTEHDLYTAWHNNLIARAYSHGLSASYISIRRFEDRGGYEDFLSHLHAIMGTDYLIENGRVGFDGTHPDQGQGAEAFFCKWGDDWGEPLQDIKDCVAKIRAEADQFANRQS